MDNVASVSDEMKQDIRNSILDYRRRFEANLGKQGREAVAAIYADALGRCHYYLGSLDDAAGFFKVALRLCKTHLETYRKRYQGSLRENVDTWREAKQTELVSEMMRCIRPAWWIGHGEAKALIEEALQLCEKGMQHRAEGVQLRSRLLGVDLLLLMNKPSQALQWLERARTWLEEHPDYPFEDPGNGLDVSESAAKALVKESESELVQALNRIRAYMERNHILPYGINPSNPVLIYEVLRRKLSAIKDDDPT